MTGARIAVIVASMGRPDELGALLERLAAQSLPPAAVILSVSSARDLPAALPASVRVATGAPGLCAQRNRGLELALGDCDVVLFVDDDYVPSAHALARIAEFFETHPDVVGATGLVLKDGIGGPGVSHAEALELLDAHDRARPAEGRILRDLTGLYGCNMAYRAAAIGDTRFDERLPLYGWQEDIDFAVQLGRKGRIVKTNAFSGVHRGVKNGRTSGVRFGYSQIANPAYLVRKGTMPASFALRLMARNLTANHLRSLWPEPWVDRRGRLKGNWLALADLVQGAIRPERVLELK